MVGVVVVGVACDGLCCVGVGSLLWLMVNMVISVKVRVVKRMR